MSDFEAGRNLGREDREGETQFLRTEVARLRAHRDALRAALQGGITERDRLRAALQIILDAEDAATPYDGCWCSDLLGVMKKVRTALEQKADTE